MNGKNLIYFFKTSTLKSISSNSLGYQSFMLSLKSQISILDNFVIREESITPVLNALMTKEPTENSHNNSDNSLKEVIFFYFNTSRLAIFS